MKDRSGFLELEGANLWYAQRGDGPPLAFLHAGICDSRSWEPQLDTFSRRFDTLRYDRRGFGLSQSGSDDYHPHEDLLLLLDYLQIDTTHLVGCSQGGKIAVDFALAFPKRVSSLVLVSSALSGYAYAGESPDLVQRLAVSTELEVVNGLEIDLWVVGAGRRREQVPKSVIDLCLDMNRSVLAGPEPETLSLAPPAATQIGKIQAPTLIVTGDRDVPHSLASSAALADGIPDAKTCEFPDCAHLPNLEQPGPFNQCVLDFYAEAGLTTAPGQGSG